MTSITQTPAYRVAFSMYVALGGDKTRIFDSVEDIYAEIDKFYGKGSRITTEALIVNIGENGSELYNDDAITGYKPVRINVDVPQKYTDAQVEELKETSRQQGYDSGYDKGIADGYVQGESEGYTDGYAEGLEDGAEDQKALLETLSVTENGTYTREDGWNSVTVEVEGGIPEEELNAMLDAARTEGYDSGVDDGMAEQKAKLTSTTFRDNGTYTSEDGWSTVIVQVEGSGGGDSGKPKIYNGFKCTPGGSTAISASNLSKIDFSVCDWSNVTDLTEFFAGFSSGRTGGDWSDLHFANFKENFNGQLISGKNMFKPATGSSSYAPLFHIPDFSKFTANCVDLSYTFADCVNLTGADNIANWNTSNVIDMNNMFYYCKKLTRIPLFDTSSVINMSSMFYYCQQLTTIPELDFSNVQCVAGMFYSCNKLNTLPNINCYKLKSFSELLVNSSGSAYGWLYGTHNSLTSIGEIRCDSVYDPSYMLANSTNNVLTHFGGAINLGKSYYMKGTTGQYFMSYAPNLDYESVLNVLNGLYDRASAGYPIVTLKLHANHLALLSDADIAIATNKGWTLS